MERRKKAFLLTLCTLFVCLGFGIISLAESKSITKAYGDFYLNCYISCEATCGIGSTSGIASPYKNYVAVTIYNINQKPIASNYKDAY